MLKVYSDLVPVDFVFEFFPAVGHFIVKDRSVYKVTDIYHYDGETVIYCTLERSY